jgi:ribosome assembly protein YihI (activator of Der GTPase)
MSSGRSIGSVSGVGSTSSMKVGETTMLPNGLASMRSVRDSIEAERNELIQSRSTRSSMGNDSIRYPRSSGQSFKGTRVSGPRSLESESIRDPDGTIISRRIETIEAPAGSSRVSSVGTSRSGTSQRSTSPRRSLSGVPTTELQSSRSSRRSRSLSRSSGVSRTPEEIDHEEIDEIDYPDGTHETITRSTQKIMSPRSSSRIESPRSSEDEFTQRSLEKSETLRELLDELQASETLGGADPSVSVSSRRRRSVSTRGIESYNPMTEIPPPRSTFNASGDCGCDVSSPATSVNRSSRPINPSSRSSTIHDRTAVRSVRSTSPSRSSSSVRSTSPSRSSSSVRSTSPSRSSSSVRSTSPSRSSSSVRSTSPSRSSSSVRSTSPMVMTRPIDDLLNLIDEIGIDNTIRGKEHRSIDVSQYSQGQFKVTKSRSGPGAFDLLVSDNLENYQWALDDILDKRPGLTYNGVRLANVHDQLIDEFQGIIPSTESMSPRSSRASRMMNGSTQSQGQSVTQNTIGSLSGVGSVMGQNASSLSGVGSRAQNMMNSAGSRVQSSLNSVNPINSSSISGRVSSSMNSMI